MDDPKRNGVASPRRAKLATRRRQSPYHSASQRFIWSISCDWAGMLSYYRNIVI
jgi:hypothetical protein